MRMRAAFSATVKLAEERGMIGVGPDLTLDHLRDMESRIQPSFSEAKVGRWLGWAQAAVAASGCASLEEMKQLNLAHADGNDCFCPECCADPSWVFCQKHSKR